MTALNEFEIAHNQIVKANDVLRIEMHVFKNKEKNGKLTESDRAYMTHVRHRIKALKESLIEAEV